jgi:E3 ubiquitin-protein ligase SHPRH
MDRFPFIDILNRFLRVPSFITSNRIWKRLLSPAYFETFKSLFDTRLAVRTSKAQVKDEFQLPVQTRYVVPIDFGRIERTVSCAFIYQQNS